MYVSKHNDAVLKHTYGMHNICNVRMSLISGISIGIAAADGIGYRVPGRYQSNPSLWFKVKVFGSRSRSHVDVSCLLVVYL